MTVLSLHLLDGHLIRPRPKRLIPASLWKRIINFGIDYIGATILLTLVFLLVSKLSGRPIKTLMQNREIYPYAYHFLGLFAIYVYYVICEFYFNGKTIGKIFTKTRVVNRKGRMPCLSCIMKRSLFRFIPFEPFSLIWFERYGWHDSLSGTLVVED